jgi:hypothetical protein
MLTALLAGRHAAVRAVVDWHHLLEAEVAAHLHPLPQAALPQQTVVVEPDQQHRPRAVVAAVQRCRSVEWTDHAEEASQLAATLQQLRWGAERLARSQLTLLVVMVV